jgi:endogenous inhibitor of DNA gyrase (YacG/DUF329 family)
MKPRRLDIIPLLGSSLSATSGIVIFGAAGIATVTKIRLVMGSDGAVRPISSETQKKDAPVRRCQTCGRSSLEYEYDGNRRDEYCSERCKETGLKRDQRETSRGKEPRQYWRVGPIFNFGQATGPAQR